MNYSGQRINRNHLTSQRSADDPFALPQPDLQTFLRNVRSGKLCSCKTTLMALRHDRLSGNLQLSLSVSSPGDLFSLCSAMYCGWKREPAASAQTGMFSVRLNASWSILRRTRLTCAICSHDLCLQAEFGKLRRSSRCVPEQRRIMHCGQPLQPEE